MRAASRFRLSITIIQPKRLKDWSGYCVLIGVIRYLPEN